MRKPQPNRNYQQPRALSDQQIEPEVIVKDTSSSKPFQNGAQAEPKFYVLNCGSVKSTIIYNTIWLIFLLATHIINVIITGTPIKTHCYLTNLTMLLTCFYLIVSILYLSKGAIKDSKLYKWVRVLYPMSMAGEATVLMFYWAAVGPYTIPDYDVTCNSPLWCYIYTSIAHGLVIIPSWTPLFASWIELKPGYLCYPLTYAFIYTVCILIPYSKWVENLYSVMTFDDAMSFVYMCGAYLLTIIGFFIGFWIFTCRRKKYQRIYGGARVTDSGKMVITGGERNA